MHSRNGSGERGAHDLAAFLRCAASSASCCSASALAAAWASGSTGAGAAQPSAVPEVSALCKKLAVGDLGTIDRIAAMLDRCFAAERDPMANVMLPLALEAFIDDLAKTSRIGNA